MSIYIVNMRLTEPMWPVGLGQDPQIAQDAASRWVALYTQESRFIWFAYLAQVES